MKGLKNSLLGNAGLSKKAMIEKWLDEMDVRNYTINPDMTIDVNDDVILCDSGLKEIPNYIQFNEVNGNFDCSYNNLTSLKGCPRKVFWIFNCSDNRNLKSLIYGPKYVKRSYVCSNCNLKSLYGLPDKISCGVYFRNNKITSIDDVNFGNVINGDFYCNNNPLKSLKGCPEVIKGSFNANYTDIKDVTYFPKKIEGSILFINRNNITKQDILNVCNTKENTIYLD